MTKKMTNVLILTVLIAGMYSAPLFAWYDTHVNMHAVYMKGSKLGEQVVGSTVINRDHCTHISGYHWKCQAKAHWFTNKWTDTGLLDIKATLKAKDGTVIFNNVTVCQVEAYDKTVQIIGQNYKTEKYQGKAYATNCKVALKAGTPNTFNVESYFYRATYDDD